MDLQIYTELCKEAPGAFDTEGSLSKRLQLGHRASRMLSFKLSAESPKVFKKAVGSSLELPPQQRHPQLRRGAGVPPSAR